MRKIMNLEHTNKGLVEFFIEDDTPVIVDELEHKALQIVHDVMRNA